MLAERFHLHTDQDGNLVGLPHLKPNQRFEVILLSDEPVTITHTYPHRPSPKLIGSAEIKGDLTEPVFTDAEWAEVEAEWDELYPLPDKKQGV